MSNAPFPLYVSQSIPSNWQESLSGAFRDDGTFLVVVPGVLRELTEIGIYLHHLGLERARAFADLVIQKKVWDLPGLTMLRPDEPITSIRSGEGDARLSNVWPMHALPPEVLDVLDAFHRLVDEARISPLRVLAGEARLANPVSSAHERLEIEFTLHNRGIEAIAVLDPTAEDPEASRLRLVTARPPPKPGKPPLGPQRFEIPKSTLSRPDQRDPYAPGRPGTYLDLAPGQTLRFVAKPSLYFSPGQHLTALCLDLNSLGPDAPPHAVKGMLTMEMQTLQVIPTSDR